MDMSVLWSRVMLSGACYRFYVLFCFVFVFPVMVSVCSLCLVRYPETIECPSLFFENDLPLFNPLVHPQVYQSLAVFPQVCPYVSFAVYPRRSPSVSPRVCLCISEYIPTWLWRICIRIFLIYASSSRMCAHTRGVLTCSRASSTCPFRCLRASCACVCFLAHDVSH